MAAVAFSGGLDSSVLVACAKRVTRVVACTAAVEGAPDVEKAKMAAAALGVELVATRITPEMIGGELQGMRLPFEPTVMDASLWCLYTIVSRSAAKSGAKVILLGQLADELFGGYAKYRSALANGGEEEVEDAMRKDIEAYPPRGRVRDVEACAKWVQPRFPFGTEEVVRLGLSFPVSFKISDGESKLILRKAASILGVPANLVERPKKAAQYSSGIQKVVAGTSLFNGRRATPHHDSIATAEGKAGGVQASAGEVQLLRP